MKAAIKECMTAVAVEKGSVCAEFIFPETFVGFQGHFPGQPVLPGVCLIQTALVAANELVASPLKLESVVSAKFFSAVLPDMELQVKCSLADGIVKASVTAGDNRISKLKLGVADA